MATSKKTIKDVSKGVRMMYQKATEVTGDMNYALMLALDVVKAEPAFVEAREYLRKLEFVQTQKLGGFAKFLAGFKAGGKVSKGKSLLKNDPRQAMNFAEEALAIDLKNTAACNLLIDASIAAEMPFIAVEIMQTMCKFNPNDIALLNRMSDVCELANDAAGVYAARQKICDLRPADMDAQRRLRDAAALVTLNTNDWEKEGSFTEKIKNSDQAAKLEQEGRIVRNEEDVAALIEEYEQKIASGNQSIDLRRNLAMYYQRSNRHEDAIAAYRWIAEKTGRMDPAIDKSIEKSELAMMDEQAEANPEQAEAIAQQKLQLRLDRARSRVEAYPNDLALRFEFAEISFEVQDYDTALEEFQQAQRNPAVRLQCIVNIGRIFHFKKQFDMARTQFEKALKEMPIMDNQKMDTLYFFGMLCEDSGDAAKARECFQTIYQVNVRYRDVKQRIEGTAR